MLKPIIDAHIHLDWYIEEDRSLILQEMEKYKIESLISVSQNLSSAKANLALSKQNSKIKPAFGFHPEQLPPTEAEVSALHTFILQKHQEMVAIGEVGLPYYLRKEDSTIPMEPYIELLESFIQLAQRYDKPVVLHAVYEDAAPVCDLLEKYSIKKAHFHWFKSDQQTIKRMVENGYFISITPDIVYEQEIQELVNVYPLSLMMVETDGPWPFKGPFLHERTHPKMIHQTVQKIAQLKGKNTTDVYRVLYENTKSFYYL